MAEIGPGTLQGRHGRRVSPPDPGAGSELFAWVDAGPAVIRGFTQRAGGVSEGAYASLNLGSRVADDPAAVAALGQALRADTMATYYVSHRLDHAKSLPNVPSPR